MVVIQNLEGGVAVRELSADEVGEQQQAVADAESTLRNWRSLIAGTRTSVESADRVVEPPPVMPPTS
jgi:hypothetical protein